MYNANENAEMFRTLRLGEVTPAKLQVDLPLLRLKIY
jgi:hypothetical protein